MGGSVHCVQGTGAPAEEDMFLVISTSNVTAFPP